ncbi:MAG: response regulator [Armatimonadetes bacterium]|nr:response regulator [Armatimonadota bacterium]
MTEESPRSRILVVDDNVQNVELLEAYLDVSGYEVEKAGNGLEALERVGNRVPDLILLDIMMPGIDGYEVCRRLRQEEKTRLIPIVMLTALKDLDDKIKGIELGADDFLTKPFSKAELLARIRSLLRIKRLHDELAKANAFKSQMISLVAHELRTPLATIKGFAELMQLRIASHEDGFEYLHDIMSAADNINNMVTNLLDLARIESGKIALSPHPFDARQLALEMIHSFQPPPTQHTFSLDGDFGIVHADRDRIVQVFANLLSNAVKYSPQGGQILVKGTPSDSMVLVEVRDAGVGIPESLIPGLFERFYRAPRPEIEGIPGTGLGLSIIRSLVELHGGKIWVESTHGKGTSFFFTLPLADSVRS